MINVVFLQVHLIVTEHAKHFFNSADLPPNVVVYDDSTEWQAWKNRGDPVVHIELGKWADLMVLTPLDANTLAKMAQVNCSFRYINLLLKSLTSYLNSFELTDCISTDISRIYC